ncbi:unnamed protein product [Zymoseptoria tritici ST99CH_1E4]|uniref:Peptidase A1 domain-containing protein n=1 Tax=Zymoseptoria tritici ST99CH_1E4 TaxID=1276532 RepID=A0A2H1FKA7_ZYMTR|nr:unnamed protein product [Zymoseptoria tritici ST99CH_1E4]
MERTLLRRLLQMPTALLVLAFAASHATAERLDTREKDNNTILAPISINPDQNWDGIDGAWSTFTLRVGNPAQNVRTLVSTAGYQTWVVLPQGCQAAASQTACAESRGWTFDSNASTSFDRIGIYDLWIERNLGYTGNAIYGYDAVGLGGQGEGGPTLKNTTVGTFAVEDFYLGMFGVNSKATNFTDFNTQSPSYMALLKEEKLIPSVSFGYTAGAQYRSTGVLASLTLGGYDASKFVENELEWTLGVDNDRDIVVAIQSVSTPSNVSSSPVAKELLPEPIYAYVDSTIPHIWLPEESCRLFESEFGLIYDNVTNLYLVNDTLHQSLLDRDATVTFSLGQELTGGQTTQISLPYAAFDLTAKPPYKGLANDTRYFPLQQAQNATQYTLGRTFLQEAYLSVNWESATFNVSQVSWDSSAKQSLVAMLPSRDYNGNPTSTSNTSSSNSNLTTGAKAGIAIAAIAVIAIIAAITIFILRRHKDNASTRHHHLSDTDSEKTPHHQPATYSDAFPPKAELEGGGPGIVGGSVSSSPSSPAFYLSGALGGPVTPTTPSAGEGTHSSHTGTATLFSPISEISEADGRDAQIHEMPGDMPVVREKDGRSLSEKEALAWREKVYNGVETNVGEEGRQVRRSSKLAEVVRPEEVVEVEREKTLRRAFSFELNDGETGTGTFG